MISSPSVMNSSSGRSLKRTSSRPPDGVAPRGFHRARHQIPGAHARSGHAARSARAVLYRAADARPRAGRAPAAGRQVLRRQHLARPAGGLPRHGHRLLPADGDALAGSHADFAALALELHETYFDGSIDNHFATLPMNFYPARQEAPLPGAATRCAGDIQAILQPDDPGARRCAGRIAGQARDGSWQDVTASRGQFIVNIGDMMQRWTNDRWLSTLHRVVNPPADAASLSRRMSIGFFLHPNYDAVIAGVPTCIGPAAPARYEPVAAGEMMRAPRWKRAPSGGRQAGETGLRAVRHRRHVIVQVHHDPA